MFYDQLQKLCDKSGTTPTNLLKTLGMSKGSLANWKAGSIPKGDMLVQFSEHFGVSIDYLIFGREHHNLTTEKDMELLDLVHSLPIEEQEMLKSYLQLRTQRSQNSEQDEERTGTENLGK